MDTIPLRVSPVPGEALDSWLDAYAYRLRAVVPDIFQAAGLPRAGGSDGRGQKPWIWLLLPEELAALSIVTAVPETCLAAMTLAHYDGTVVTVDPDRRVIRRSWWCRKTSGSRFCPPCLAENCGRWPLAWRLPWTFACLRHRVLLADVCPSCCNRVRLNWPTWRDSPEPAQCRSSISDHHGRRKMCGYPLTTVQTCALPADGLILEAESHVGALIRVMVEQRDASPGRVAPAALLAELDDIHAVGRAAISAHMSGVPLAPAAGQILAELGQSGFDRQGKSKYGPRRLDVRTIAFCIAVAVRMLRDGPSYPDPVITRWILDSSIVYSAKVKPPLGALAALKHWNKATPSLQGALLKTLAPQMTVSQRLRYCTSTSTPAHPAKGNGKARARAIPALLWPGWALRLNPGLFESLPYRATLSMFLLLAASRDNDYASAWAQLGHTWTTHRGFNHVTSPLDPTGALDPIFSALGQLGRMLDERGAPIDYARRRALFTPAAFDHEAWRDCCNHIGHPIRPGQKRIAEMRLTEILTGNHPRYFPPPFSLDADKCYAYAKESLLLPAELVTHLDDQAQRLLAAGQISEPVQWEPPFDWIQDVSWPGPEVRDAPAGKVRELLEAGHSHQAIAGQLETSVEHIRLAAACLPAALSPRPAAAPPNLKIPRSALPGKEEIRAYYAEGLGRRVIARLAGCGQSTAARLIEEAGLAPRLPDYRSAHVTAEWLTERYVVRHLTLQEIAAEAGLAPKALARLARDFGIKLRRGGAGHRNSLSRLGDEADFPPGIWAAFQRSGGENRVRRVLSVMEHPTFEAAAQHLHIHASVISVQVAMLEKDLDIRLVNRSAGKPKITVTLEGRRFARRARRILEQIDQT